MPLDPAREQVLQDWLSRHTTELACPLCGDRAKWSAGVVFTGTTVGTPGGPKRSRKPPTRMVQVICVSCGYILLFAAEKVGL